jgi:hypothetical protein
MAEQNGSGFPALGDFVLNARMSGFTSSSREVKISSFALMKAAVEPTCSMQLRGKENIQPMAAGARQTCGTSGRHCS